MSKANKQFQTLYLVAGIGALMLLVYFGYQYSTNTLRFQAIDKIPPQSEYNMTDPVVASGYRLLEEAYTELEALKGKDLQTVNVIDPGNKRGIAYAQMKDTGRAILSYEWVNLHRPLGLQGFVNVAKLYTEVGEYKKAEQNYLTAIANSKGKHTDPYQGIFELYRDHLKDKLERFEGIIKTAITQTPDQTNFYLLLAQYYELKGLTGDAITQYRKILELEPNNPAIQQKINELSS